MNPRDESQFIVNEIILKYCDKSIEYCDYVCSNIVNQFTEYKEMATNLSFYKTSKDGAVALTQLAKNSPKARLLIDWVSMILVNRSCTANAVMVSNDVLQEVLGCSINTVTKAIKDANKAQLLGVGKIGANRVYYLNPTAIKMDTLSDNLYAFDVAVVIDKDDDLFKSIKRHKECKTFGIARNGSGLLGEKGNGGVIK